MTYGEQPSLAELDEVLGRAVERQIAEQRALRQALEELRDAVLTLRARGDEETPEATIDTEAIDETIQRALTSGMARLEGELREVRGAIDPQLELTQSASHSVRSLRDDMRTVRESVGEAAADIEGIAEALVELNAGLRGWAEDVEGGITSLRDAVESVREVAQTRAIAEAAEAVDTGPALPVVEGMEQQLKETAELSLYLSDQIEDLDGVLKRLAELPERLEGAVAQAMRRTLAAGAKLEQDAAAIFDSLVESLEASVARLSEALEAVDATELHRISLGQVELATRVDTLHESLLERVQRFEETQSGTLAALAKAIDAFAAGRAPAAADAIAKAAESPKPARKRSPKRSSGDAPAATGR